ncbi:MAG: lysophospholipid acyltransferase family protein [Candidatus Acinetobacter avistercoris]|nr:lysophospholipid acyltransferase family protein [Candidatus Acinetobacter avistercoris]
MYSTLKTFSKLPMTAIQSLAKAIGRLLFITNSSARKTTEINLRIAYPKLNQDQRTLLIKKSLESQCMTYAESIKIWGSSTNYALSLITKIHNENIFFDAINAGQGVIVVVPHFGTWELLNVWLNQYSSPVIMYKPNKHKDLDRFMLEARQRLNATLVPTDESGVRAIFKHLKQGGLTAILPDHVPKESGGVYSPFYGQNTLSSTLVSKLASKTQCAVIGLSCRRTNQLDGFEIFVNELSDEILSKDLQLSVDTLNKELEHMINAEPHQYLWSYKRFRRMQNEIKHYE